MEYKSTTIRTFIGAKDYNYAREFYQALGFQEFEIDATMCLIKVNEELSFYLQDYYVKDWIENSMLLLSVDDIEYCEKDLMERKLSKRFKGVRISGIKDFDYGREIFLHDPSGVLWHFCQFK